MPFVREGIKRIVLLRVVSVILNPTFATPNAAILIERVSKNVEVEFTPNVLTADMALLFMLIEVAPAELPATKTALKVGVPGITGGAVQTGPVPFEDRIYVFAPMGNFAVVLGAD